MKKIVIAFTLLLAVATAANAQYQLPNPGFEQWDGGNTSEPVYWNSFASSDGTFAAAASTPHHYRRGGGRPGSTGNYYLTIYTLSIFGIKANGNMTTGRIHAGAMTAASSENYNYTERGNSDHSQPFSGTPDSMYLWVSFYAQSEGSQAQVSAILHGNNDFKSPNQENDPSLYCAKATAAFTRTTSSANSMQWQQIKVPFVYDGNASPAYMLINLTTNSSPGSGDANDSLSIDDIEFIYSSWLKGISVDGEPISWFSKGTMDYTVGVSDTAQLTTCEVTATPEAGDATLRIDRSRLDDTTALVAITVTAEDGVTMHTYCVTLTTSNTVGIDAVKGVPLQIYPNPATERVTVEAEGEVSLHDLTGRLLTTRTVHGSDTFDLTAFPAGVYLLRHGQTIHRVIKK